MGVVVYYGSSRHFPGLGMSVAEGRHAIVFKALLEGAWTKCDHHMTVFKRICSQVHGLKIMGKSGRLGFRLSYLAFCWATSRSRLRVQMDDSRAPCLELEVRTGTTGNEGRALQSS